MVEKVKFLNVTSTGPQKLTKYQPEMTDSDHFADAITVK
jgi:hypothetical protein